MVTTAAPAGRSRTGSWSPGADTTCPSCGITYSAWTGLLCRQSGWCLSLP